MLVHCVGEPESAFLALALEHAAGSDIASLTSSCSMEAEREDEADGGRERAAALLHAGPRAEIYTLKQSGLDGGQEDVGFLTQLCLGGLEIVEARMPLVSRSNG